MRDPFLSRRLSRFVLRCLGIGVSLALGGCGPINVMGRNVPDSEYFALYDAGIAREKNHLEPDGVHDEHGRIPSWNEYWCTIGGATASPSTPQSRRMRRYIVEKRRALGLKELTCGMEYKPGDSNPGHYYAPGDPRIFQ